MPLVLMRYVNADYSIQNVWNIPHHLKLNSFKIVIID